MKMTLYKLLATTVVIGFFAIRSVGQPPPPSGHGEDGDQQPAPIGSGLVILMALGAAYGAKKVYDARKRLNN